MRHGEIITGWWGGGGGGGRGGGGGGTVGRNKSKGKIRKFVLTLQQLLFHSFSLT